MSFAELNRAYWNAWSDEYQELHRSQLSVGEPAWGMWSIPEAELQVLGDVAGKDVLELGCGAAQWSILLARRGARVVGLDGEWIRLFRRCGLTVEELIEPRPAEHATTTYEFPLEWARRRPCECIWKARKMA